MSAQDHNAVSEKLAASDAVLKRLMDLHPKVIDLSLGRLHRLLDALGNPEQNLPPVVHIAGTNGKGSTTATVRAIAEAAGYRVHVYTSPHLVRFHERIRLAGQLIGEDTLVKALEDCELANAGEAITYFEITTAAALLAFSRVPADLCILEVGLGGRLDATNVIDHPLMTAITPVSKDHEQFLGDSVEQIAFEKAGIIKTGCPVIIGPQSAAAKTVIADTATDKGAKLLAHGVDWFIEKAPGAEVMLYEDTFGRLELPLPTLPGSHQIDNAGTAIAILRHQGQLQIPDAAIRAGLGWVRWPARMQNLTGTAFSARLQDGHQIWLDGGHNPAAASVIREFFLHDAFADMPKLMILGMMGPKDAAGYLAPLVGLVDQVICVPIPGEDGAADPSFLAATATDAGLSGIVAKDVQSALTMINDKCVKHAPLVLIGGSLYLAGQVLRSLDHLPD